jgi:tetratricopeptide (TPR) repeat protein
VYLVETRSGQAALIGSTPLSFSRDEKRSDGSEVIQLRVEKEGHRPRTPAVAAFGNGTTYLDVKLPPAGVADEEIRKSFDKLRAHLEAAQRLALANRYSEALAELEQATALDPKNAEAHAARGSVLYLMKDLEGARESWTKALEINPNMDNVRASLIDLNLGKGTQP